MVPEPDAAPSTALVDSLVQLSFAVQGVLARAAAEHDLSLSQLRLLGILRDRRPPMAAIADHLGLDRSSITGLVDRAERRGLVVRTTSTRDARVTIVSATPTGLAVARRIVAEVSTGIELLVERLPHQDRDCLVRAAGAMLDAPVRDVEVTGLGPSDP
jgi:MarR family transcriptional regulator, lower aerobic nicotinate degradation pathway regulator